MLGNGISVDEMETVKAGDHRYRWLTVDQRRRNAVYWMQSGQRVTDDFRTRLKEYMLGGEQDWVMVTLLFDERLNLPSNAAEGSMDNAALERLMTELQTHYSQTLKVP